MALFVSGVVVCFSRGDSPDRGQDSLILLALFAAAIAAADARRPQGWSFAGLSLLISYALPLFFCSGLETLAFPGRLCDFGCDRSRMSVWLTGFLDCFPMCSIIEMSANIFGRKWRPIRIHPDGMPNLRGLAYMLLEVQFQQRTGLCSRDQRWLWSGEP